MYHAAPNLIKKSVADPGFLLPAKGWGANLLVWQLFPKNWIKLKKKHWPMLNCGTKRKGFKPVVENGNSIDMVILSSHQ